MSKPASPPPLVDMATRTAELELERKQLFDVWKVALENADGNVTAAGKLVDPPVERNRANRICRRVGLDKYAASLRSAAAGRSMGRPSKSAKKA